MFRSTPAYFDESGESMRPFRPQHMTLGAAVMPACTFLALDILWQKKYRLPLILLFIEQLKL